MELDKRIIEGKKPLDCFDAKDARKQFIGKKGYFGAHESQFMDLDSCPKCVLDELKEVDNYAESPFMTSCNHCYRFFLPEEWVKEPEKYRPYSLAEWINQHEIGEIIHYRSKSERIEAHIMYMGTYHHKNKGTIVLGVASFTLDCLFEDCEIEINGEWLPFGVLDDNK
jgi:hypothetical protein